MGRDPDRGGLERLLGERGQDLMRAAVALTGSRADGEDLLQAALERLLRNWRRVDTDPEGTCGAPCTTWPPMAGAAAAGGAAGSPSFARRHLRRPPARMSSKPSTPVVQRSESFGEWLSETEFAVMVYRFNK